MDTRHLLLLKVGVTGCITGVVGPLGASGSKIGISLYPIKIMR